MSGIFIKSIIIFALLFSYGITQKIATLDIFITDSANLKYNIVKMDLDKITYLPQDRLKLFLIEGETKAEIPIQLKSAESRTLYWIANATRPGKQVYELHSSNSNKPEDKLNLRKENGSLIVSQGIKNFLAYQFETMYPPAGVDSVFKRSAYIHPLWSPKGQVLTRIQPPDHYHHYGIWNPWTHVLFEKDTVDFWNLKEMQGTVRHNRFVSIQQGSVFAEFQALHEHVVFKKDGSQKVALNELQTVQVYSLQDEKYIVDLTINLNCASDSPVKLLEYRYGGFGWRASEQWDKDNSEMLSSLGKTRKDIDNTNAEWFYVQGSVDNDYAGVLMMSNPANFNHPQPMRMWGIPDEGRGDVFASFSPTRNRDWLLEAGKSYTLRYRFVVYNGHFNAHNADQLWQNYQKPLKVIVKVPE